jgi:hypothetical protein
MPRNNGGSGVTEAAYCRASDSKVPYSLVRWPAGESVELVGANEKKMTLMVAINRGRKAEASRYSIRNDSWEAVGKS